MDDYDGNAERLAHASRMARKMSKDNIPHGLQIAGLVTAVLIVALLVEHGGNIDRAFWLFLTSLPACAIGLFLYKLIAGDEFEKPKSWPEWIFLYVIGMVIGGPLVALGILLRNYFF